MHIISHFSLLRSAIAGLWKTGLVTSFAFTLPASAQTAIVPDTTLGTEASAVTYDADTYHITAGASRGPNLFHSFDTFSIPTGEAAYFVADSSAIAHIFARVTGSSPSDIHGTLGTRLQLPGELTSTDAALFLLNPHGLLFSDTATLDMAGAFYGLATAAIPFDGGSFSAVAPQSSTLLAIAPEVSFFNYLATAFGPIHSTAHLASPADLTLVGKTVVLQGELRAGQTLNVLASDRLTIQDSSTTAFVAEAGEEMELQGNQGITIHALHHPNQVPFVSGGDLTLVSDGIISADAHFTVGGNFATRQPSGKLANLQSPEDPIFEVVGDFSIGNYAGASLQVTAGNDITYGAVSIDAIDPAVNPNQPALILTAGGGITGTGEVVTTVATGALAVTLASEGDITVQGITTKGGNIDLRSQTAGIVSAGVLDTRDGSNDAGDITLNAAGDITANSQLNASSFAFNNSGDGGAIAVVSRFGTITFNAPLTASSFSVFGNAGDAGAIGVVSDTGNIDINEELSTDSFTTFGSAAAGGVISVASGTGNINIDHALTATSSGINNAGNGGTITTTSDSGNIEINGQLTTASSTIMGNASDGGIVTVSSNQGSIDINKNISSVSSSNNGVSQNGGAINVFSGTGDINIIGTINSPSIAAKKSGNGGTISIFSDSGNINTEAISSFSLVTQSGNSGDGGNINISSESGHIETLSLFSVSLVSDSGSAGNGGNISLSSDYADIKTRQLFSFSSSDSGSAGNGGDILLKAPNGALLGNVRQITTATFTQQEGLTGESGDVTLVANEINNPRIFTLSETGQSGSVDIRGVNDALEITNLQVIASSQIKVPVPFNPGLIINLENTGQSGNTSITSPGDIFFTDVQIQSDANGNESAGGITISSPGEIVLVNSRLDSNTTSEGNAGQILIEAERLRLGDGGRIFAATAGTGTGGNITLNVAESVTLAGTEQGPEPVISVATGGSGRPGNITVNTPILALRSENARITATALEDADGAEMGGRITVNADLVELTGEVGIIAGTLGNAPGGTVELQPYQDNPNLTVALTPEAFISASTEGAGAGGNVIMRAPGTLNISGPGRVEVETLDTGLAGSIFLEAEAINLADGAVLTASTEGAGTAGNIVLNVAEAIAINNSIIESRTIAGSTGRGGSIRVDAADTVLQNGGEITVTSAGTGPAGAIVLVGERLLLDGESRITANTASSGNGGNLTLTLSDYALMQNGSLISTEAGTEAAGGNGGDITIESPFLIALPGQNNDIIANAFDGNGGQIEIKASGIYGFTQRSGFTADELRARPTNDISASSQFGQEGTIDLNALDFDPSQELEGLSETVIDTETLTAGSCIARRDNVQGSFVVTGQGSFPTQPTNPAISIFQTGAVRAASDFVDSPSQERPSTGRLVEPTGVFLLADGRLVLSHTCDRARAEYP